MSTQVYLKRDREDVQVKRTTRMQCPAELDQLHQIRSIIITITITPPNFSITLQLQLLCAKNRKLQL